METKRPRRGRGLLARRAGSASAAALPPALSDSHHNISAARLNEVSRVMPHLNGEKWLIAAAALSYRTSWLTAPRSVRLG